MKKFVVFIICSVFASATIAQELLKDLSKIRQKYFEPDGEVKFNLRMLFYDVKNLKQVEDSSFGTFRMSNNSTYADFENMISISNDSIVFVLDRAGKQIFLSRNTKGKKQFAFSPAIIDSLAKALNLKISSLIPSSKELKKYRLRVPESEADSVDIEYNPSSFLVKSLTVYYRQSLDPDEDVKPVVKILYENQVWSSKLNSSSFDIGKYVVINNKTATLKEQYSSYRLINNLIF